MVVRFMHTADLHLDQPFKKLRTENQQLYDELIQATYQSFERLIDTAINEYVDFVLIAGDIYDANHGTMQAQFAFNKGMQRLQAADIPVYLAYGNHDYLADETHRLQLPDNVHLFPAEVSTLHFISKSGETVDLSGFSYHSRWIDEKMTDHFPQRNQDVDFHIGVLHGEMSAGENGNHYAPFTLSDLKMFNYNYWALGHIHQRQIINENPLVVYPGNIQGSSFKENGAKGAYLVTLEHHQTPHLEFVETADWQFLSGNNPLPEINSLEDLRAIIEQALHEYVMYAKSEMVNVMLRLQFTTDGDSESLYWWDSYADELLEQLQWSLANQQRYREQIVYLAELGLIIEDNVNWSPSSVFHDALKENWHHYEDTQVFEGILSPLLKNSQWQKLVAPRLDREQFQRDVLERAAQYIVIEQATNQQEQRGR